MSGWQPMKNAPGGTMIRVKLKSGKEGFVIWTGGFLDEEGEDCGGWNWIGHNPPRSWTDGVCWELNEDNKRSVQPIAWKPCTGESSDE